MHPLRQRGNPHTDLVGAMVLNNTKTQRIGRAHVFHFV